MEEFDPAQLKNLYKPAAGSHKGQNGKLLIIAGSTLFHAASLWPLTVASRMLDMVFYASVPENNEIVQKAKEDFRNGIVVTRDNLESYIQEADCVLIGPGLMRTKNQELGIRNQELSLEEINDLEDEGEQTYYLTQYLLTKYPGKRYVIDGGALQMMDPQWLLNLSQTPILTPHRKEFENLKIVPVPSSGNEPIEQLVELFAAAYNCVVLLKGEVDIVAGHFEKTVSITGGNAGMTKGGTGDVLAGLVASLYCKNDAFLSACAASYINKKAGESLESSVGIYFNASDLSGEIPKVMKELSL